MNAELTLTVEQEVIAKAKKYAKFKGRSLFDIIKNYLKLSTKTEYQKLSKTFLYVSLLGPFKEPEYFNYKKEPTETLEKNIYI